MCSVPEADKISLLPNEAALKPKSSFFLNLNMKIGSQTRKHTILQESTSLPNHNNIVEY